MSSETLNKMKNSADYLPKDFIDTSIAISQNTVAYIYK